MKKAIGGLLVVSMLSVPQPDYMAYLTLRNHSRIVFINDAEAQATPEDVNYAINGMEENSRLITHLLRERASTLGKIEARLDILRHARTPLDNQQMACYAAFMENYRKNATAFGLLLKSVEGSKNLRIVQKEILSENTDYNQVMGQLGEIISAQNEAIDNLSLIICEGEVLFEMLV